ncbi:tetratricopeptide repeat protein [Candidatus Nitronereus thalassa]|uniref:Tetratricopeptide repeat protein n=1 Tax=Candidatus Nitronereus thalassa TaxID=3020898 RepID=A0ABU3K6M2_9BACT|nr:tetratricopeptide repeat protein [Candidatus Nitronereus thalassa]MDT7042085.1 tetratricopeptide repeat protein [Candidatus Nitronereus thalassa]
MGLGRWFLSGVFLWIIVLGACTTAPKEVKQPTLHAPTNANPMASSAISEGNELFASGRWQAAREQYEKAIAVQHTVAEAHYNLALTLDQMGNREEARAHYMEAANLAPGHQVIWNSPVLRRYGDVPVDSKKGNASAPVLPSLGGAGGLLGGGGGGAPGGY